jgi:hypothetical protein
MSRGRHEIQRQVLDVRVRRGTDPRAAQDELSASWRDELVHVVEASMDECDPELETLVVDRLEIDLGAVRRSDIADRLRTVLTERLRESARAARQRTQPRAPFNGDDPVSVELVSDAVREVDLVWRFLATGVTPWHVRADEAIGLPLAMSHALERSTDFRRWLIAALAREVEILRRVVWQMPESTLREVLEVLVLHLADRTAATPLIDNARLEIDRSSPGERSATWLRVLHRLAATVITRSSTAPTLRDRPMGPRDPTDSDTGTITPPEPETATTDAGAASPSESAARRAEPDDDSTTQSARGLQHPPPPTPPTPGELARTEASPERPCPPRFETLFDAQAPAEVDIHYVANGGLVLLHPFFAPLFQKLALLGASRRLVETSVPRAVHLLQFLVTGRLDHAEHELVLAKLLCGVDARIAVPREVGFAPHELVECESLLNAAIAHWAALGTTSPDGLREGFLLRPARLAREGVAFLLQVERRAHDVLLGRIPWSFGMIRLSWMKAPLRVVW